MAVSSVTYNKPVLPRTTDSSDLGSNRASIYSGKALSFDGSNDSVTFPDSESLSFGNGTTDLPFSITGYFNLDTLNRNSVIASKDNGSQREYSLFVITSNKLRFFLKHNGGAAQQGIDSDLILEAGKWYFVSATYDGRGGINAYQGLSIYVNGQLTGVSGFQNNSYTAMANTTADFAVGNYASSFMDGKISNIKLFDFELNHTQVAELYNNPEQAVPTGVDATSLVLHLPMTEGAGSYVYNANANAIGTELISNAGFDETCQKWGTTDSSTVEIAGGKAIWTNAPLSGSFVEQPLDLEVGKFYRVKFDYTSTAFNIFVNLGDTQQAVPLGNGTFVYDMYYGSGSSSLKFQHGWTTSSSATVDNVSVKEVVPNFYNGIINGATWVQGLPEPLPQTALMDWNKYPFFDGTGDRYNSASSMKNFNSISGGGVSSYCRIVMGDKINNNQNFFSWGDNDGFRVRISDNNYFTLIQKGGANVLLSTTSFTSGKLYTVVAVVDSAGSRLYLDGLLIASNTTPFNNSTSADNLTIGGYNSTSELLDGTVIDVKLWEYGLSDSDASALSANQITPESLTDYEIAHFDGANDFDDKLGNYSGIFGTKEYQFQYLIPEGSTAGKDVFGNTITNPRASGAYNFDGNSWAEVQDNASLDFGSGSWTFELWLYWDGLASGKGIMSRWYSTERGPLFYVTASQVLRLYTGRTSGSSDAFTDANTSLTNGWHHIVGTYDLGDTKLRIYIDGAIDKTGAAISSAYASNAQSLEIGRLNNDANGTYANSIAQPRIYNYALTAEQVADNFNEKASTFGGTKVASELDAYIERTASDGATVEAHSCLVNYLTELDKK